MYLFLLFVLCRYSLEHAMSSSIKKQSGSSNSTVQIFGGPWSLIKTATVDKYIRFFNTALKNMPFERVYIDAFAGSGAFRWVVDAPAKTLFGPHDATSDIHAGSAPRALTVNPPFQRIFFIEQDEKNAEALEQLIAKTRHPKARVLVADANQILRKLCKPENWRRRRGVIFLDPFGMNVEWSTLQFIANTKALDLWFLFSLGGLVRNLPISAAALDAGKFAAVTRVLGTKEWFAEFYKIPDMPKMSLWGEPSPMPIAQRVATVDQIEEYVRQRLLSLFPHVEEPKRLRGPRNQPLFSLFFAVSNPSKAAIKRAQQGASYILRQR
jgi:three-Cys-motif partner protein